MDNTQERYFGKFIKNMESGISYYQNLFKETKNVFKDRKAEMLKQLEISITELNALHIKLGK